jgi:hypothetical protein
MNEEALNDSYQQFVNTGYNGSLEDYKKLLSTNQDALNDAYALFSSSGYTGDVNKFSDLIGVGSVKKKDDSQQDLSQPAKPSGESSESKEEILARDAKPLIDLIKGEGKPEEEQVDVIDYDTQRNNSIQEMKALQKRINQQQQFQDQEGQAPGAMFDNTNVTVSDNTFIKEINPEFELLNKKKALTFENARKAFKSNYLENNPEVVEKLNSGDGEKIEEANKEIYKAFAEDPVLGVQAKEKLEGQEADLFEVGKYGVTINKSAMKSMYDAFREGMSERDFNVAMALEIDSADEEDKRKILEMEYERSQEQAGDIQEPQSGLLSAEGMSKMAGTQAVPLARTMAIGMIPGVGRPASIMYSSADAMATSYGAAARGVYIQARNEGKSQEEAFKIAMREAKVQGSTGAAEGALAAFTGGGAKWAGAYTSKFANKAIKPLVDKAATGTADMGFDAIAAGVGQIINNWSSKSQGLNVGMLDGVGDEMLGEVIFSAGIKIPTGVKTVSDFKGYVNSLPTDKQQELFNTIVDKSKDMGEKVSLERTQKYLDESKKEAIENGDKALAKKIEENPIEFLEETKTRLNTVEGALSDKDPYKEDIKKNIEAIDLMIKNVPVKEEAVEVEKQPEKVEEKAPEAPKEEAVEVEKQPEKVEEKAPEAPKEEVKEEVKPPETTEKKKEVPAVEPKKEVTPEEKRKFAVDAITTGQIVERKPNALEAREDFGMSAKDINSAIQNIKDVESGKKSKYTKPAEQLLGKLEEFYEKGDIPIIEGTGGISVRDRGVPIREVQKGIDDVLAKRESETKEIQEKAEAPVSQEMRDWLNGNDEVGGKKVFDNAKVADVIQEFHGDKIPENSVKKAINAYRKDVEAGINNKDAANSGVDIIKATEWYGDLTPERQKAFESDFRASLGVKPVEKVKTENRFIKRRERTIFKQKIADMAKGAKEGAKAAKFEIKNVQKDVRDYSKAVLDEFNVTKATRKIIENKIINATRKSMPKVLAEIDGIVDRYAEKDRQDTIKRIKKTIASKKSIRRKVGTKWKGAVPPDVADFIKTFDTSKLNGMSRAEVKRVEAVINEIIAEGKREVKALEKEKRYRRSKTKARGFKAFFKGHEKKISGLENLREQFTEQPKSVMIIDGHQISSKSALNEYAKDNPDADFNDIEVRIAKQAKISLEPKSWGVQSVYDFIRAQRPFLGAQNLLNTALSLGKAGQEGYNIGKEIGDKAVEAEINLKTEASRILGDHIENINEIFYRTKTRIKLFKRYMKSGIAATRLRSKPTASLFKSTKNQSPLSRENSKKLIESIGQEIRLTNDRLVNWYNIYKTKDGKSKLDEMGVDMDIVNNYIESNQDLKEFADYLVDEFYPSLRGRYEPVFFELTNEKFGEGLYYPLYRAVAKEGMSAIDSIIGEDGMVDSRKSIAGSLKARVDNKQDIDLTKGAFDVSSEYIQSMERSKQFLPYAEFIDDIFTKQATPEIIEVLGKNKYRDLTDHISTVIKGVNPRKGSGMDNDFVNAVMKIKIFSSLAGKFASVPKQVTSFSRFMLSEDVSLKELFQGAPKSREEFEVAGSIMKHPWVLDRLAGMQFDLEAARMAESGTKGDFKRWTSKAARGAMSPVAIGDIAGVLSGGVPYAIVAYRQERAKGLNHQQAMENAQKRFVSLAEKTQQSSLKSQLSLMQMSNMGRLFSMYTTSQKQGVNQIITAAKEIAYDKTLTKKQVTRKLAKMVGYSAENMLFASVSRGSIYAFYRYIYDMITGDDTIEYEEVVKELYDTGMDNIQSLISGTGYSGYFLNMIVNSLRDDEWKNELALYQELNDLSDGAAALLNLAILQSDDSEKDLERVLNSLPVKSMRKQMQEFLKAAEKEKSFAQAVMSWKSEKEKKGFKPKDDKIYKAIFDKPYSKKGRGRGRGRGSRSGRSKRSW